MEKNTEVVTRRFAWDPADAPKLENGRWAVPVPGSRPVFEIRRAGREPEITHDPCADLPTVPAANPLPPDHPRHAAYEGRTLFHSVPSGPDMEWRLLGFEAP